MPEEDSLTAPEVRHDGVLLNALTGLGDPNVDPSQATVVSDHTRLTKIELEELGCNWICNNIVSAYPKEATREWVEIKMGGEKGDPKLIREFDTAQEDLNIKTKFYWADYLANLYRGAAIIIVADDGLEADKPLKKSQIKKVRSLEVLDCHKIIPDLTNSADPLDPEFYRLAIDPVRYKDVFEMGTKIHHSRVLRFDGIEIPPDAMLRSNPGGWGLSRLELVWDAFRDYESVYGSVAGMTASYNVFKMGIRGMAEAMKTGGVESEIMLQARFRSIQKMMSSLNGIAVDAEKESVEFISRNFAGIADTMDRFTNRLVGASDLPYTMIFGRAPGGITAQGAGDNEEMTWAKKVQQYQEYKYRKLFKRLADLIWASKEGPSKGKEPEDWNFSFKSLIKETPTENMALRSTASQTYSTYLQMGVLDAEEIRNSQFGGSEYSIEITLDKDLWEKKKQEALGGFGDYGGYEDPAAADPNAADPNAVDPNAVDPNAVDPNAQPPAEAAPPVDPNAAPQQEVRQESFLAEVEIAASKRFRTDSLVKRAWIKKECDRRSKVSR